MEKFAIIGLFALSILAQSCATIVGGSKYNAIVVVKDHPQATITYDKVPRGSGTASILIPRRMANRLVIDIKDKGCEQQTFRYTGRTFRGWAFVGTIITWTGYVNGLYIPWGVGIDLATGAVWKPTADAVSIIKVNHKIYTYPINYTGCDTKAEEK